MMKYVHIVCICYQFAYNSVINCKRKTNMVGKISGNTETKLQNFQIRAETKLQNF